MLKLAIFDLDGTLIDSDLMIIDLWRLIYKKYRPGYRPTTRKLLSFSGPSFDDSLREEVPEVPTQEIIDLHNEHFDELYESVVAFPFAKEFLLSLKEKGIKLAVNTNKMHLLSEWCVKHVGFGEDMFDVIVSCDDVKNVKPDPEGIFLAMKQTGITDKSEVIFFGDSVFDIKSANNAGVKIAIMKSPVHALPEGTKADYFFDGFDEAMRVIK